jgi:hypothetical protein
MPETPACDVSQGHALFNPGRAGGIGDPCPGSGGQSPGSGQDQGIRCRIVDANRSAPLPRRAAIKVDKEKQIPRLRSSG